MEGQDFVAAFTNKEGELVNVEAGASPPSDTELEDAERVIVHYISEDNEDVYFTVLGGFDASFTPIDAIMTKIRTGPSGKYPKAYPGELQ